MLLIGIINIEKLHLVTGNGQGDKIILTEVTCIMYFTLSIVQIGLLLVICLIISRYSKQIIRIHTGQRNYCSSSKTFQVPEANILHYIVVKPGH
jgi:hypothetical protein